MHTLYRYRVSFAIATPSWRLLHMRVQAQVGYTIVTERIRSKFVFDINYVKPSPWLSVVGYIV